MLYVAVRPHTSVTLKPISECTDDVSQWFFQNNLLLDPSMMLCGTQVQCNKVNTSGGVEVAEDFITLLGVKLDSSISMNVT